MHANSNVRRWRSVPGIKWLGFMELDFHDALNCCLFKQLLLIHFKPFVLITYISGRMGKAQRAHHEIYNVLPLSAKSRLSMACSISPKLSRVARNLSSSVLNCCSNKLLIRSKSVSHKKCFVLMVNSLLLK